MVNNIINKQNHSHLNSQNIIIKHHHIMTSRILVMVWTGAKHVAALNRLIGSDPPPQKKQHSPLDNCISNDNSCKR